MLHAAHLCHICLSIACLRPSLSILLLFLPAQPSQLLTVLLRKGPAEQRRPIHTDIMCSKQPKIASISLCVLSFRCGPAVRCWAICCSVFCHSDTPLFGCLPVEVFYLQPVVCCFLSLPLQLFLQRVWGTFKSPWEPRLPLLPRAWRLHVVAFCWGFRAFAAAASDPGFTYSKR